MSNKQQSAYYHYSSHAHEGEYPYLRCRDLLQEYQHIYPEDPFLALTATKSFSQTDLHTLVRDGWTITALPNNQRDIFDYISRISGACDFQKRHVEIDPNLRGIRRDITVTHEFVHAWYGEASMDYAQGEISVYRRALVELFARHIVAQIFWMKTMVRLFGLPTCSYPRHSFLDLLPIYPTQKRKPLPLTLATILHQNS